MSRHLSPNRIVFDRVLPARCYCAATHAIRQHSSFGKNVYEWSTLKLIYAEHCRNAAQQLHRFLSTAVDYTWSRGRDSLLLRVYSIPTVFRGVAQRVFYLFYSSTKKYQVFLHHCLGVNINNICTLGRQVRFRPGIWRPEFEPRHAPDSPFLQTLLFLVPSFFAWSMSMSIDYTKIALRPHSVSIGWEQWCDYNRNAQFWS